MLAVGVTCSDGALTVSVAFRVWVPCPVSELVKVIVDAALVARALLIFLTELRKFKFQSTYQLFAREQFDF